MNNSPFFVIGVFRSGTTLLRLMLNKHPRLCIPYESFFLSDLIRQLPSTGVLSENEIRAAKDIIAASPRFQDWETDEVVMREAIGNLEKPTLRDVMDIVFRLETADTGKPRWGDKTPAYVTEVDALQKVMPDAQFIHIYRDGRDVSLSLKQRGWAGWSEFQRAHYWTSRVNSADASGSRLGGSQYLSVYFGDLVASPEAVLRKVCDFLGEEYHPSMLNYHEDASDNLTEHSRTPNQGDEYIPAPRHDEGKLAKPLIKDDIGVWQRTSSPLSILLFESIAGSTLDRLGLKRFYGNRWKWAMPVIRCLYTPPGLLISLLYRLYHLLPDKTKIALSKYAWVRRIKGQLR